MAGSVFVKADRVLTPHGFLVGATVEVRDGAVSALWPAGTAAPGEGDEVWDLSGQVLLPGLVNAHTHAAMNLLRGYADDVPLDPWLREWIWPAEARLTAEDVLWGTKLALLEMIASGTTTFADMYFAMDEVAEAVREAGVRAVLARGLISTSDEGDQRLAEGIELFYRYHGSADGRITVWLGPHAPYTTTPAFLERVGEAASDLGTGVHIHLAETREEVEACRAEHGCSPVGLLRQTGLGSRPVLAAHAVHVDEKDIEAMAEMGTAVAHCPVSNLKLGCGMAPVAAMLDHGLAVGLGSDGAASANTLDLFQEMKASAWGAKGFTGDPSRPAAAEVLAMATEGGARALGLGAVAGRIEPGFRADMIGVAMGVPDLAPLHDPASTLVYAATGRAVRTVMVDGRLIYRDGRFLTLDADEIMERAEKSARRITS